MFILSCFIVLISATLLTIFFYFLAEKKSSAGILTLSFISGIVAVSILSAIIEHLLKG